MRDYRELDDFITDLEGDIYEQPNDIGHYNLAEDYIEKLRQEINIENVLDVGCGDGFARGLFESRGISWTGVTLGSDYDFCVERGFRVIKENFNFLSLPKNSFDCVFGRHSLEHSPMPLYTLKHWASISRRYVAIVLPNPAHFRWNGRNHYSVMADTQFLWLAARAGLRAIWKEYTDMELRYILEKAPPRTMLMWESEDKLIEDHGPEWRG